MRKVYVLQIILFAFWISGSVFPQSHKINIDTTKTYKSEFYVYPFAFYTPEKRLAFGAGGVYSFRNLKWDFSKPSKILFSTYYTTAHQYLIYSNAEIYLFRGKILFSGVFWYEKLIEKFYGFGPETPEIEKPNYKMNDISIEARFYYSFTKSMLAGFSFNYKYIFKLNPYENPFLTDSTLLGSEGGANSGFGLLLRYDTRDNIFYPSDGYYVEISATFYGKSLGSKYSFEDYSFNARKYLSFSNENILAFEVFFNRLSGSPPFYSYPRLGGSYRMRGYYEGRYRDKEYFTIQSEYRTHIYKRIFGAIFIGAGDVFASPDKVLFRDLKWSYGFGLRYRLSEEEKMNVRFDVGFGEGTYGIYFQAEEAF